MTETIYLWLANGVVLLHVLFVLFAVFGGLLLWRNPLWAWLHIPAVLWAGAVELGGWLCPLTPLENALRRAAGAEAYAGDFIAEYILPTLYPVDLTREIQIILGGFVLLLNGAVYWHWWRKKRC